MRRAVYKKMLWIVMAASIFLLFRWLFGLAIPEIAFQFAAGITAIIMAGVITGRYAARLWHKAERNSFRTTLGWLIASALLCLFLIGVFINKMIEHTQFNYFFFTVIAIFLVNAVFAMIISMVRHRIKRNMHAAQTALAQSKTELQLLSAQLSPHFLFNTLNNLYGLSLTEHQKVPELLLKLSDLLRYSVYEAKEVFMPIPNEIDYLKNYIEFEKIRLGERLSLSVNIQDVADTAIPIAPMLLIVFVENAFKHSKNNDDEKVFIGIELKTNADTIFFSVINSCSQKNETIPLLNSHAGFGLKTVKKRLALLYPDKHALKITASEKSYSVTLSLKYQ